MKKLIVTALLLSSALANSQDEKLKKYLSADSTLYIRTSLAVQTWVRYNANNPGTTIFGNPQSETFDIGIRRARLQMFGKIHKHAFMYVQLGINNYNAVAQRKPSFFVHDAVGELHFHKTFHLGAGLSGWSGFARFAAPSIASTLGSDAPLFQQVTNDVTDQFLRKLSVYAKGKIKKFDYRVALSKPLPVQTAPSIIDTVVKKTATFSPLPPQLQSQAYFQYQFWETEQNATAYTSGTYYGKKKVLTLGAGVIHQADAMRFLNDSLQKEFADMLLIGADVFVEYPFDKEKRTALNFYGGFFSLDLGPKYSRNAGVMNVATGTNAQASLSGVGNAFPMVGTGNVIYAQTGYLFKKDLFGTFGTLQPYMSYFQANYEAFADPVVVYEGGINWLVDESRTKVSFNWQSRPVFFPNSNGDAIEQVSARRNMFYVMLQVYIQ